MTLTTCYALAEYTPDPHIKQHALSKPFQTTVRLILTWQHLRSLLWHQPSRPYDLDLQMTFAVRYAQLDLAHARRPEHLATDKLRWTKTLDEIANRPVVAHAQAM